LKKEEGMTNTIRRTLTLIKFTDGVWVVESNKPFHHPGANYASDAKFSLLSLFKGKTQVYNPKEKAKTVLCDMLFYLERDDLEVKPHFHRDGVEWHPVVARMHEYCLDSSILDHKKKKNDWQVTPLAEHPLAEKLKWLV
jgi:hypothetical protein